MTKEYARFKKYLEHIGWIYDSVRMDGKVFWKLMYQDYTFFCNRWKMETEFETWGKICCPDEVCRIMQESGWTMIKGPKSVTESTPKKNESLLNRR